VALSIASVSAPADEAVREMLRDSVEQLAEGINPMMGGAKISSIHVIPRLYQENSFQPLWTDPRNVDELLGLVESSFDEGLDPEDYHLSTLRTLLARRGRDDTPDLTAVLDVVLTDSLVRLGYHLFFGKVNPGALDADWNLSRDLDGRDPVELVREAIASPSLEAYVDELIPRGPIYEDLKAALAEYRGYAATGGWPVVPDGKTLKPEMEDARVAVLRRRLTATPSSNPNLFDSELERAVKSFQSRHKLDTDGVVGPETLAAINVPIETRIDQIRVNLERARWVLRNVSDEFVVVNIAGFRVWLVRDGEPVWTTRAQVGKQYRMTPVFASTMKYLVFNPTWTVPPGILSKDILPKLKKDPGYLEDKHLRVIDGEGRTVAPATIDFSSYTARTFPYQLRQDPGPWNALGQVKFIFPNPHFVFLHDTPSRTLFERRDRTFSSGCIRTENPLELAELLLDDPENWSRGAIQEVLDSKKSRTVFLKRPIPVLLLYWTVIVSKDGEVLFLRDVYERDGRILEALDGEFEFDLPPDLMEILEAG
jgi:murein L,D-transpeptidase YcbB/YkuD